MNTGPRPDGTGQLLKTLGLQQEAAGPSDGHTPSREVDERTAIYLLSLARELLRRDHGAIANMIDYAIVEIELQGSDTD